MKSPIRRTRPSPVSPAVDRTLAYTSSRPDVLSMVPIAAQDVLDVGCSNGAFGRSLKAASTNRIVVGIEVDSAFAREASGHLDLVVNADLNTLDWRKAFSGRSFDCVIFADVLEHLVDPGHCLTQAREFLRPNGCLVISLPNIRHLSAFRSIYLKGHFPQRPRGLFDRTHLRWFTISDVIELLDTHGFAVSEMSLALRWGDQGGGRANRLLNRLPQRVKRWGPVREFLTYQTCLRATLRT